MNSRSILETPIGRLALTANPRGLTQLDLLAEATEMEAVTGSVESAAHLRGAEEALNAYFSGAPDAFRDVVVGPEGTDFQRTVWSALRTIPEGTTISYGELAQRIGKPDAVRAVGLANGRNPIPIIVPCHRVIGADRSLTGFGLGIAVKAWLLVHERAAEPFPAGVTVATRVVAPASFW
jgi:methylated-DNA-[protein]-cysteine S-methyltransferase